MPYDLANSGLDFNSNLFGHGCRNRDFGESNRTFFAWPGVRTSLVHHGFHPKINFKIWIEVEIESSPFKTILRKFSYGILLTCSLLDIMLCSFTLWANLTEEVTPLSCRLTEKIRNIFSMRC